MIVVYRNGTPRRPGGCRRCSHSWTRGSCQRPVESDELRRTGGERTDGGAWRVGVVEYGSAHRGVTCARRRVLPNELRSCERAVLRDGDAGHPVCAHGLRDEAVHGRGEKPCWVRESDES
jgi:hypothetical protein